MADNRSERFNNEVDLEGDQMPRRYTDPFEGKLGQRIIEEKLKKYERDLKKTRRDIREIASDLTDNYDLDDEQAQSIARLIESMSNHTHNYSDLEGTPDLAAVATSGSYNDLDDKPTIPDVSGKANSADLAAVATSGSYNDLDDKPTIPDVSGKANSADLAAVATSGSYNDLDDKPTIPDVSGKANSADLAAVATSGSYNDLDEKPTIPAERFHTVTELQFTTEITAPGNLYFLRDVEKLVFVGMVGNYEISLTPYSANQN